MKADLLLISCFFSDYSSTLSFWAAKVSDSYPFFGFIEGVLRAGVLRLGGFGLKMFGFWLVTAKMFFKRSCVLESLSIIRNILWNSTLKGSINFIEEIWSGIYESSAWELNDKNKSFIWSWLFFFIKRKKNIYLSCWDKSWSSEMTYWWFVIKALINVDKLEYQSYCRGSKSYQCS